MPETRALARRTLLGPHLGRIPFVSESATLLGKASLAELGTARGAAKRRFGSTICATVPTMASRVVRARLDDPSEQALASLMQEGRNESEAIRTALVEAGRRRRRRSVLADEVRRLAEDPADTAERRAVMADMEAASADWPA